MEYVCFNCGEEIEVPDLVESENGGGNCPFCSVNLCLEIYQQCLGCHRYYIKTFPQCPECGRPRIISTEIRPLKYVYIKTEAQYGEIETNSLLGLDTEGNSLDPFTNQLFLVQIGNQEMVYIFDVKWHQKLAKESFWKDKSKLFIIHNVKYDYKVLKCSLKIELQNVFDTFLAERILTCGLAHKNSLKNVVEKYFDVEMDKEIRNEFITMTRDTFEQNITTEMIEYSAKDVLLLPLIFERQSWDLISNGLMDVAQLEFEVCKVVSEMELKGIFIDTAGWKEIIRVNKEKKSEVEKKIHALLLECGFGDGLFTEDNINLNSTKDLMKIFRKLGVEIKSTMDEDLAQVSHPFAALLREYRGYEKQLSAFGESFLELIRKETQRIHSSFQQIGADTGRFSCNNPNLQQIPADEVYRKCFVAPKGKKLVSIDYSQQELRILASLSGDPKFIKFYEDGVDLHTATASMMFNIPIAEVKKETHRKVAKTINFGLAYGQGARALGITIGVDEKEAEVMIDKYFSQFTYIRDWLNNAAKMAQENGYSTTLMGRKRFYNIPDKNDPEYRQKMASVGRRGKNTPIQGSGSDMIKLAMVMIYKRLRENKLDAFLISVVHDELILESADKDAEATAKIVKNAMIEAGRILAPNVPILAEGGACDYWTH